ncbi:MAG: FlgD immunoglobulin-like domain containing protein [Candidatus Eiseniibacteriota bacterium]
MTHRRIVVSLLSAAGAIALLSTLAGATLLKGSVLGNGAMPAEGATGGGRILYGTVGQAAVGASGSSVWILCHGYWCFGGVRVISVDGPPELVNVPKALAFGLPMPNPAPRGVSFSLALPEAATVDLAIYDVQGRLVQRAVGDMEAGWHTLRWDGTDNAGRTTSTGVYFARLRVDEKILPTRQIIRVP